VHISQDTRGSICVWFAQNIDFKKAPNLVFMSLARFCFVVVDVGASRKKSVTLLFEVTAKSVCV
jgi:hypothetical protein